MFFCFFFLCLFCFHVFSFYSVSVPREDVAAHAERVLVEAVVHRTGVAARVRTGPVNDLTLFTANPVVLPRLRLDGQGVQDALLLGLRRVCKADTLLRGRRGHLTLGTAIVADTLELGVEGVHAGGGGGGNRPRLGLGLPFATSLLDVVLEGVGVVAADGPALRGVACDLELDERKGLHLVCHLLLWYAAASIIMIDNF